MSDAASIFHHHLHFDAAGDFDAFLKLAPAKWSVYLMADEHDQPVQLLCVKNLRASLKRRLGGTEMIGPTRKVNYQEIVHKIHWCRVDSSFEADFIYLEAARHIFPESYRGMVGFRPAWFVHVNPQTSYPRYVKTQNLTTPTGRYFGPLEDKHSAQKLVHLMENVFDLCRDYSILIQSPNAGPCPWKQMDKCIGPCDGTISLHEYAQIVGFSAQVLADPQAHIEIETQRMNEAAADLRFEIAQKIKSQIDQLSQLGKGPFRHLRSLERFAFLSLQRGPYAGTAKLFLITQGEVEEVGGLIADPKRTNDLLRWILARSRQRRDRSLDAIGTERIGVVAHHLFVARNRQGVFLDLDELEERNLATAYRDLLNQKVVPENDQAEGVTRELQAM